MASPWLTRATLALVVAVQTLPAWATPLKDLSHALISFEEQISWKAVDRGWKRQRSSWVRVVERAGSPQALGKQAVALELALGWKAMEPHWRNTRADWIKQCEAAASEEEVAQALLTLEGATRWTAVNQGWQALHAGWIRQVKKAGGLF